MRGSERKRLLLLVLVVVVGLVGISLQLGPQDSRSNDEETAAQREEPSNARSGLERRRSSEEPEQAAPAPPDAPLITGGVQHDTDDVPIVGATVALRRRLDVAPAALTRLLYSVCPEFGLAPPPDPVAEAVTDAEGNYRISPPDAGPWVIVASAPGFATSCQQPHPEKRVADFRLSPHSPMTLRVVTVDGDPVAGARVVLFARTISFSGTETGSYWSTPLAHSVSDENGRFTVEGDVEWVLVRADGYAWASVRRPDPDEHEDIVLFPGRSVAGRVVDPSGAPVAGAVVAVTRFSKFSEREQGLITEADGRFRFEGMDPREETELEAAAPGWTSTCREVRAGETDLRIVLSRPASISGRVLFPGEGDPEIGLSYVERWNQYDPTIETEEDGRFRCDGMLPGRYRLWAMRTAEIELDGNTFEYFEHEAEVAFRVAPGEHLADIEVRPLPKPSSFVALRIVDQSGDPIRWVDVFCDASPDASRGSIETNEDGVVILAVEAPAGTRVPIMLSIPPPQIHDDSDDRWETIERETAAAGSLRLEQVQFPEIVHDVTILGADGQPLGPDDLWSSPEVRGAGWVAKTAEGTLKASHSPGMDLVIRISAPDHPRQDVTFSADQCRGGGPLTATLDAGVIVRGRILTSAGEPYAGQVLMGPRGGYRHEQDRIDPVGAFEFSGTVPGVHVIVARRSKWAVMDGAWTVEVDAGSTVDVGALHLGPPMHGTVTVEGSRDGSGTTVTVVSWGWPLARELGRTTTAPDGSFTLPYFDVPDEQIEFRRAGFAPVYRRIGDLVPGKPIAVHLTAPTRTLRVRIEPAPSRSNGVRMFVTDAASGARRWHHPCVVARSDTWGESVTYEFDDLPAGPIEIDCETKDAAGLDAAGSVRGEAGKTDEVTLRLAPR